MQDLQTCCFYVRFVRPAAAKLVGGASIIRPMIIGARAGETAMADSKDYQDGIYPIAAYCSLFPAWDHTSVRRAPAS